jgi:hypothetical protein
LDINRKLMLIDDAMFTLGCESEPAQWRWMRKSMWPAMTAGQ